MQPIRSRRPASCCGTEMGSLCYRQTMIDISAPNASNSNNAKQSSNASAADADTWRPDAVADRRGMFLSLNNSRVPLHHRHRTMNPQPIVLDGSCVLDNMLPDPLPVIGKICVNVTQEHTLCSFGDYGGTILKRGGDLEC